jgi:hypothetical protein
LIIQNFSPPRFTLGATSLWCRCLCRPGNLFVSPGHLHISNMNVQLLLVALLIPVPYPLTLPHSTPILHFVEPTISQLTQLQTLLVSTLFICATTSNQSQLTIISPGLPINLNHFPLLRVLITIIFS